jgi:hypothetical protein
LSRTERASHPVGTTVKVTDFFKSFPVRKQDSLKHSARVLAKIRRLMQAYALARPTVRFQLRVLKAKSEKGNFNYAPKPGANVEDAAFKIIGRDCASQCEWTATESDGYEVHALVPKLDAIGSKISGEGAFLSVDFRPVSSVRGTMKKIVAMFKERLRKASPALASVKDPFVYMNITCPPGSYDPNIEPAKDDLLFEDANLIVAVVDKLLSSFYPEAAEGTKDTDMEAPPSVQHSREYVHLEDMPSSECLKIYEDEILEAGIVIPSSSAFASKPGRQWRLNMYGIDEEDLHLLSDDQPPLVDEQDEERRAAEISNPWTIAKMNAPNKTKRLSGNPQLLTPAKSTGNFIMSSSSPTPAGSLHTHLSEGSLTSMEASSLNIRQSQLDAELEASIHRYSSPRTQRARMDNIQRVSSNEDVTVLRARHQSSAPPSEASDMLPLTSNIYQRPRHPPSESNNSGGLSIDFSFASGTPLHMIPDATAHRRSQRKQHSFKNKPFTQPVKDPKSSGDMWFGQPMHGSSPKTSSRPNHKATQKITRPLFPVETGLKGPRSMVLDAAERLHDRLSSDNSTDIRSFLNTPATSQHQPSESVESSLPPSFTAINAALRSNGNVSRDVLHKCANGTATLIETERDIQAELRAYAEREAPPESNTTFESSQHRLRTAPQHHNVDASESQSRTRTAANPTCNPTRKPSARLLRRRTSKLPLERIPPGHRIQNLILPLTTNLSAITQITMNLNMSASCNSVEWGYSAEEAYDTFAVPILEGTVRMWAEVIDSMMDDGRVERGEDVDVVARIQEGIMAGVVNRMVEDEEMLLI